MRAVLWAFLLVIPVSVTLVPGAAAHDCEALEPITACGACPPGSEHDHRSSLGYTWCASHGGSLPYLGDICESCQTLVDIVMRLIGGEASVHLARADGLSGMLGTEPLVGSTPVGTF